MKKNSIISIIIILLILLTAILFVRSCNQEGSEMKNYTVAGTYNETATYQNGEIKVSDVNIENATFTGNLTVTDAVADGEIRLTNAAVQGELLVKGGDTIYLDGGAYQNIILEKPGVKIVLLGEATVETLTARAAANIVVDNQSKVKTLNVEKAAARTSITTQENGTIENIQARGASDIILNTPAKLIGFGTNAGGSTLVANAVVDKIVAESKVILTLNANVGTVLLTTTGEGTSITLGNNAVIASLATETRVEITGEGSVTSATTNDVLYITGTVTPEVVYITTKPVVSDTNGSLAVSTNTNRVADSSSSGGSSGTWYSGSSDSGSVIDTIHDTPFIPPTPPNPPSPTPPTPPSPPVNISVEAIQVTPVEADVIMGNTLKLNTVIFPKNATNQTIIWETSNNAVATVTNGVVTPVSNGETTITARTQDGNKTDTCKITVKTNVTAVTMINTINTVNNNIAQTIAYDSSYSLPVVVIAQGYGSELFPCSVTWSPNTVDTKKIGETIYTGTLVMPTGYVNLNNTQALITLTVLAQPVITASSELSSQRVYLNEDPAPVFVEADVTDDKTLTYQWSYRIGDVETPLPEVTGPIYDPPASATPGTVYYNCVISSENADPVTVLAGTVVTSIDPAVLPVTPDPADPETGETEPVIVTTLAEIPTITEQPTSISQLSDIAVATSLAQATRTAQAALGAPKSEIATASFRVAATVNDGGVLTYQWFESSVAVNADGKAVDGATDKTFAADTASPAGTTYYYVEITNTKAGCLPVTAVSLPVSLTVI
ncbi:Ig-like domain-containing protein [Acetobacterium sp. K1/6]|uniref:Ig-like domain-containing protein n=1 Tax=Acetobacterium sp. K1/6 TaxID=3055467 RepID=UPI002ACA04C9|nr:Ig-like domain-containing protein [Acetobacterium sp. K1/6]MDZ5724768.1 Ig-like domain-containing protein [Acetobacterium sp. K1/6]